jgi:hypothetical protein
VISTSWKRLALYGSLIAASLLAVFAPEEHVVANEADFLPMNTPADMAALVREEPVPASVLAVAWRDEPVAASHEWTVFSSLPSETLRPDSLPTNAEMTKRAPTSNATSEAEQTEQQQAPEAPPLPFGFLGRATHGDHDLLFLSWGEQNLIVRAGDVLEGRYKVERIEGDSVTFVHLALNQKQVLSITNSNRETTR